MAPASPVWSWAQITVSVAFPVFSISMWVSSMFSIFHKPSSRLTASQLLIDVNLHARIYGLFPINELDSSLKHITPPAVFTLVAWDETEMRHQCWWIRTERNSFTLHLFHLADVFIQSDLQLREITVEQLGFKGLAQGLNMAAWHCSD